MERWEGGRPVVSGATGSWQLVLPAVRMASSHATFAEGQTARLATCREEHMTNGELRARVAEYERELRWAPPARDVEAHRAWQLRTAPARVAAERADAELTVAPPAEQHRFQRRESVADATPYQRDQVSIQAASIAAAP